MKYGANILKCFYFEKKQKGRILFSIFCLFLVQKRAQMDLHLLKCAKFQAQLMAGVAHRNPSWQQRKPAFSLFLLSFLIKEDGFALR
jgi:hypothetical protein